MTANPAWHERARRWLPLLPALLLAGLLLPQVLPLGLVASLSPFGRDQGIFHYEGWALLQGEALYRDVRDVNGPLTPFVHAAAIALGMGDEVAFRSATLVLDVLAFALVGASLPGLVGGDHGAPTPSPTTRAAWALASVAVLGSQYLTYDYWHSAQRETFCNWFLLAAVGVAFVVPRGTPSKEVRSSHEVPPPREARRTRWLLVAAGALATVPAFGKPTFALAAAAVLAGVIAEPGGRARRAAWWCGGALAAGAVMTAALAATGDLGIFLRVSAHDVPAMYRFIWPHPVTWFFTDNPRSEEMWMGVVATLAGLAAVATGVLPRRALVLALLPVAALLAIIAQRKGFIYHHHPLSVASRLVGLAIVAAVAGRAATRANLHRGLAFAAAATAACGALALSDLDRSPHERHRTLLEGPRGPERETPAYFAGFPEHDFRPWDLRLTASWLEANTPPEGRVQMYGMDPYLLYLARRRSATPYIYAYDLSAGAALSGGQGLVPTAPQVEVILGLRNAHEADLLSRLEARPPAAFVLVDGAPTLTYADALADLSAWCPRTAAWLAERFEPAATFGAFRIFLPRAAH